MPSESTVSPFKLWCIAVSITLPLNHKKIQHVIAEGLFNSIVPKRSFP